MPRTRDQARVARPTPDQGDPAARAGSGTAARRLAGTQRGGRPPRRRRRAGAAACRGSRSACTATVAGPERPVAGIQALAARASSARRHQIRLASASARTAALTSASAVHASASQASARSPAAYGALEPVEPAPSGEVDQRGLRRWRDQSDQRAGLEQRADPAQPHRPTADDDDPAAGRPAGPAASTGPSPLTRAAEAGRAGGSGTCGYRIPVARQPAPPPPQRRPVSESPEALRPAARSTARVRPDPEIAELRGVLDGAAEGITRRGIEAENTAREVIGAQTAGGASLGRLAEWAIWLTGAQGQFPPRPLDRVTMLPVGSVPPPHHPVLRLGGPGIGSLRTVALQPDSSICRAGLRPAGPPSTKPSTRAATC